MVSWKRLLFPAQLMTSVFSSRAPSTSPWMGKVSFLTSKETENLREWSSWGLTLQEVPLPTQEGDGMLCCHLVLSATTVVRVGMLLFSEIRRQASPTEEPEVSSMVFVYLQVFCVTRLLLSWILARENLNYCVMCVPAEVLDQASPAHSLIYETKWTENPKTLLICHYLAFWGFCSTPPHSYQEKQRKISIPFFQKQRFL